MIAQRWVHDLGDFHGLSHKDQENTFGRTKRGERVRRFTPYALHDGTVGLYFLGFCKTQAPLRERMEAMYGMNGQARDAITNDATPPSGSFYFAPSVETLDSALR